jgi:hypothetical protein
MIGLSLLSSVSKHNMWSYYDWVVHILCLLTDNNNPIITRPHIVFTDGRQQRQPNHNTTTYCVYWLSCCCCRPSVNTICGRIMIGLSLYTTIYCVYWRKTTINPVILRPHIVFTDGQQQPNHNTTTYCVYWRTKTTINPIIIRPHIVFTCHCCRPSVNTICGRIMIGLLLLSSVSKHNMWSCYDWVVVVVFRQ